MPAGDRGEKVRDYPKLTISIKPETKARLDAVSVILGTPSWRVIDDALALHFRSLNAADRNLASSVAARTMPALRDQQDSSDKE